MKKFISVLIMIGAIVAVTASAFAAAPASQSKASNVSATVGQKFSLEFYNDAKVLFNTAIPFTTVDPAKAYNYPDGRVESDGKSDIGLVATSNYSSTWYLKIQATDTANSLAGAGKIYLYMSQPIDRNSSGPASGSLGQGVAWYQIPTSTHTLYTSGAGDTTNTPFGTLTTLSFRIDGVGLSPGSYGTTFTYTMTTTP